MVNVSTRISQFAHRAVVTLLLATVLVIPLLFSPNLGAWRGVKPVVFEMMVLTLIALAVIQASVPGSWRRLLQFLRRGPNQPILMLVLYGAVSWYRSPSPGLSGAEWLRLACGAGLYFVVVTFLRQRSPARAMVNILIAVTILTSLFGLISYGQSDQTSMSSSFGNGQLYSGFLLILLPLLLVLALSDPEWRHQVWAQAACSLGVFGLLLAQTRSSWIGALVALGVLGVLAWRAAPAGSLARRRHQMVVPLVIAVGAIGVFLVVSQTAPIVRARVATLGNAARDPSLDWRLERWKGAWQLIREQPLFGWGIGTFPLEQARTVRGATPAAAVLRAGPSLAEEAHNEYVQVAAEMGIIGLALSLWVLGAFFVSGYRALRQQPHGFRKLVLMGCLAGVAGQAVDALSNPAWRFADVSFLFWLMMGLGVASAHALRSEPANTAAAARPAAAPAAGRLGWQSVALALAVLAMGGAWAARSLPSSPTPCYASNEPIASLETIVGDGTQESINVGQCVTLDLKVKFNGSSTYVDETTSPNTTFSTNPPRGTFPSKNVFCATAADANHDFPVYGRYCDPCTGICTTSTVHIHVNAGP